MTSIWIHPRPGIASITRDYKGEHIWTMREHWEEQHTKFERRRAQWVAPEWRPCKIWVAYYDMDLFGGWQAFVEDRKRRVWMDRYGPGFAEQVYRLFPLVLLPPPDQFRLRASDSWPLWKVAFAEQFRRRTHDARSLGVAYAWWDGS